ncbi:MAG TPA: restriction endonuclease subunit S, partial [Lentisphaeria bacterium]|nr:restriction endonuclease subunit S [Lentisphaeria bacterium]
KRQAVISHAVTKGLNPNAEMKDSGVEWLGEVPAHWNTSKLLNLTSRIGDGLHAAPEYQDGTGIYFINGNNLVDGQIFIGTTAKEVPVFEYEKNYIFLNSSSVLLSINGTVGNVALFNGEKIVLGKSSAYINCFEALRAEYLMIFLQSDNSRRYFEQEVTGTTIFNLSLNSIRKIRVSIPSISEQNEIVCFCKRQKEKYAKLVQKAECAIELMRERRTALISAAVTGKIDVRDWQPAAAQEAVDIGC